MGNTHYENKKVLDREKKEKAISKYYVEQSNDLMKGSLADKYTADETRLLYYILSFISMSDVALSVYRIPVVTLRDVITGSKKGGFRKRVFEAFNGLLSKKVCIKTEYKRTIYATWFSSIDFGDEFITKSNVDNKNLEQLIKQEEYINIRLSLDLVEHLLFLKNCGGFTSFKLKYIIKLNTDRTLNVFRQLTYLESLSHKSRKKYEREGRIGFRKLKELLCIDPDIEKSASSLKQMLMRAIEQINEHSDLQATVKNILKEGTNKAIGYSISVKKVPSESNAEQKLLKAKIGEGYNLGELEGTIDSIDKSKLGVDFVKLVLKVRVSGQVMDLERDVTKKELLNIDIGAA